MPRKAKLTLRLLETNKLKAGKAALEARLKEAQTMLRAVLDVAPAPATPSERRSYLPNDSEGRKGMPIARGVLDYFPDAIAAVAEVSRLGNDKHNPGEPMHHARGKSNDHADCIARHLIQRGTFDNEGGRHSAYLAWRALALLQEELEADLGLPLSRGARP